MTAAPPRPSLLPVALVLLGFVPPPAAALANDPPLAPDERDWLESYYESPNPERFVPQMKDWAADGTLDNDYAKPAVIAFSSQVLRQNRDRIASWYEDLAGLSPEHLQILHTAMLYSRTQEADEIMRERFGPSYEEHRGKAGKILELALDKRDTMDMLWGYFYATGSPSAIRRIVTTFRFREAPENPDGVEVPEGYVPLYKALPEFAVGSLLANSSRHPRIPQILRDLLGGDDSLMEVEREGIREVLKQLSADPPTRSEEPAKEKPRD